MKNTSKKVGYLVAIGFVFAIAAGFLTFPHITEAAANITVGTSTIISSNTVRVQLVNPSSSNITGITSTAWHIDVATGGTTPLTATSATIFSSSTYVVDLVFASTTDLTPFLITSSSYDASHGLYLDADAVSDALGNSNAVVAHGASTAVLDGQAPTLSVVTIASNNASTTWAKVDDTVTITVTSGEPLLTVTSTIATASTTIASSSQLAWTITRVSRTGDTEGTIPFTIGFTDLSGNAGTQVTATTNSSAVTFDETTATTTITSSATSPTGSSPIPIVITFGEPVTGFTLSDITITNGDSAGLTASSTTIYTLGIFPTVQNGGVNVDIAAGVALDRAGNGNAVATTFAITYNANPTTNNSGSGGGGGGGGGGGIVPAFVPAAAPENTNVATMTFAEIVAKIAQLQAQVLAMGGTTSPSDVKGIVRNLTVGTVGDDVKTLQQYLNANGFPVAASGPGASGFETTRFGGLTRAALAKWQASVGISPASGFFGPLTRNYIQSH